MPASESFSSDTGSSYAPVSALVTVTDEPAPRLIVDPPLPEPLTHGRVFIPFRTEHLRVLPVFGAGALDVSPRIGHLHVTVDDLPWHFVQSSGETIVLVGLPPGPHTVRVELADPAHRVLTSHTAHFTVPVAQASTVSTLGGPAYGGSPSHRGCF